MIIIGTLGKAELNAFWSSSLVPRVTESTHLALEEMSASATAERGKRASTVWLSSGETSWLPDGLSGMGFPL
jgi:hypothetical protein